MISATIFFRRTQLSVQSGCILWGNRVVVPKQGCQQLLQELHDTHQVFLVYEKPSKTIYMVAWIRSRDRTVSSRL